jgi:cellulose synthase/poly-beta-1,6-N-acetylglucosamine synthase-like glycosyltransferase
MILTLLTRYRDPPFPDAWPAVTVVVAARNEEEAIVPTLERIAELDYPERVEVVLADNTRLIAPPSHRRLR